MRKAVVLVAIFVCVLPYVVFGQNGFLSCGDAKKKVGVGAFIVDVRTKPEFQSGSISDAKNIPLEEVEKRLVDFPSDKNKEVIVFCRSGRRSEIAKDLLIKNGYKNVYNAGGYSSLKKCWDKATSK